MRTLLLVLLLVVVVVAILLFFGLIDLTPEGEAALDNAREGVGAAVESTGEAIQGDGN